MPLAPDNRSTIHRPGGRLLAPLIYYPVLPDGQTMLFEVERTGQELVFAVTALIKFQIRGAPSIDVPDTPVESISLHNNDNSGTALEIEPEVGQTTIAPSLSAAAAILTAKINARWDAEHADMSAPIPAADHSDITGSFGDSRDWIV